jgi:hypothetical protein
MKRGFYIKVHLLSHHRNSLEEIKLSLNQLRCIPGNFEFINTVFVVPFKCRNTNVIHMKLN